jgi:outer membrane protein insertion porin family
VNRMSIASIVGSMLVAGAAMTLAAPTIREVTLETAGAGQVDEAFVLNHVASRVGDPLNTARVSNDVKALLATGRFSTVDAALDQQADGVRLVFTVRPKYRLAADPSLAGYDHLSRRKVRSLLNLHAGDLVDDQTLGARTRALIDRYRDDHYYDAGCTWTIDVVDDAQGLATVTLTIDEGRQAGIRAVRAEGNRAVSSGTLRQALQRSAPWNVFRWVWPKRYAREDLPGIEADVKALYLDLGYLEAKVAARVETDKSGRQVAVIAVTEGPRYTIGQVDVTGITLFPEAEVRGQVRLEPGQIASYRDIMRTGAALSGFYGNRGYLDSEARPVLVPDAATRTVAVTYELEAGDLVSLRNILVRGNTRTRDKVIRRELLVYPGEIYNEQRVERSQRRLQNLGFFETVRAVPIPTDDSAERDLVFDVTEKRTGQFMLGAGFSSIDKIIGFVELSQGNFDIAGWPFTGGGQKLRLRAQFGSTRQDYEISFTEPWFLDRRLSLGFDLYRRDRNYTDYDEERTGAAVTLGKALPGANRVSLKYQIEESIINDIADTNVYYELDSYDFETRTGSPYRFQSEDDRITSSLTLALTHDTRDNPFIPTRGNRLTASYTLTGGVLGFDTDTYEVGLRTAHYQPLWFRHVLSLRTQFQVIEAFGATDVVPLVDRLFVGGGRSLRGYDYRDVGPKVVRAYSGTDIYIHRPRGGQTLATATVEYTVPIVTGIRLAGFYDIGNAWLESYDFDFTKMASAAGIGIRFDMPGFPIRIDRAWTLEKDDPFTDEDPWVIWIGYDY